MLCGGWGRSGFVSQAGFPQEGAPCASLKREADVVISVKLSSEGPEACLWHNRNLFWKQSWKGLFRELF